MTQHPPSGLSRKTQPVPEDGKPILSVFQGFSPLSPESSNPKAIQKVRKSAISVLLIALIVLTSIFNFCAPVWAVENPKELVLALYPYVPRLEQFQNSIQQKWQEVEPNVKLKILSSEDWDGGYGKEPPENVDVYVFDAIFLNYFKSKRLLLPLEKNEIEGKEDFLSYASEGVQFGDKFYAIPQLGCSNILFYRDKDTSLKNATKLTDIYQTIGQCSYSSKIPPDSRGLMIDMGGGTTNACLYMDALASVKNQFPVPEPENEQQVDPLAMDNLRTLLKMTSYDNATQQESYEAASWFSNGYGRAVVGFTESMSAMSPETLQHIDFKVMPLSDNDKTALFYADVIGIHPNVEQRGTRQLAVKLANLLASSENMIDSIGAKEFGQPQYLMPARHTVFSHLAKSYPNYQKMYDLVESANPILFTLDNNAKPWFTNMKNTLTKMVRANYTCGCDYGDGQIWNQEEANRKCPNICTQYGGWNGEWRTTEPNKKSVCGCNSCSISAAPLP